MGGKALVKGNRKTSLGNLGHMFPERWKKGASGKSGWRVWVPPAEAGQRK